MSRNNKWMMTLALCGLMLSCKTKKQPAVAEKVFDKSTNESAVVAPVTGQGLYENNCGRCHKLYDPKAYTKENWGPILVRMQKKASLDDAQMSLISEYLFAQQ